MQLPSEDEADCLLADSAADDDSTSEGEEEGVASAAVGEERGGR